MARASLRIDDDRDTAPPTPPSSPFPTVGVVAQASSSSVLHVGDRSTKRQRVDSSELPVEEDDGLAGQAQLASDFSLAPWPSVGEKRAELDRAHRSASNMAYSTDVGQEQPSTDFRDLPEQRVDRSKSHPCSTTTARYGLLCLTPLTTRARFGSLRWTRWPLLTPSRPV
jgi:hypothetical protein